MYFFMPMTQVSPNGNVQIYSSIHIDLQAQSIGISMFLFCSNLRENIFLVFVISHFWARTFP